MTKAHLIALAHVILKAQKLKEDSWDKEKKRYMMSHSTAASEACYAMDMPEGTDRIIHLLNLEAWNDAQDWAKRTIATGL